MQASRRVLVSGLAVIGAALLAAPRSAHAGRTFYGWLYGTEVMPERGAEIQTFVEEQNEQSHQLNLSETDWWISPAIGINDQLELLLPVDLVWTDDDGDRPRFTIANYGAELRYRLVTADPTDKPAFVPLVRVALKRDVTGDGDTWQPEGDLVASYDIGRTQLLADFGVLGVINKTTTDIELHPGVGVSVLSIGDVRFGAEAFAEIPLETTDQTWVAVGPNMAWSHGRSWISAAYGVGLYHIRDAPKLNWGIAF